MGKVWYLTHFSTKQNKFKAVYNASAKFPGICINEVIMTGLDLLESLFSVLTRFRNGRIAFMADSNIK